MGWEIFSPPAPSNHHLFRALEFHMSEKSFDDACQLEAGIRKFLEAQPGSFYKDSIHLLPNKWRNVVDNNGDHIVDCVYSEDCNELNYLMKMRKNFLSNKSKIIIFNYQTVTQVQKYKYVLYIYIYINTFWNHFSIHLTSKLQLRKFNLRLAFVRLFFKTFLNWAFITE